MGSGNDFINNFPKTMRKHDSIMVVMEKLNKEAHFILVKLAHKDTNVEEFYLKDIMRLHGIPKEIILDRDPKFISNFWKGLFKGFGTNMNFSTIYHPQTNGKTKRVNQVIGYMLIMHVIDKPLKWNDYQHLIEFSYDNGYQDSLNMSPFEALYGKKCNTLVSWDNPMDRVVLGPKVLKEMEEKMVKIKQHLKETHDTKKSYVDKGKIP
jgi:hypothetical protein